jgi:hypothetical protein
MLCDSVPNCCLGFSHTEGPGLMNTRTTSKENDTGYTVMRKLLEIGWYLNKGYYVFVDNYFMSVPLVCPLRHTVSEAANSLELLGGIGNFYFSSSRTNLQLDKKYIADLVPFSHMFSARRNHKKESCHSSLQPHLSPRRGSMVKTWWQSTYKTKNHHILQQFMGGVNSSDMMLHPYFGERRTVRYWKKVAFKIIARMVMSSYRGPGIL